MRRVAAEKLQRALEVSQPGKALEIGALNLEKSARAQILKRGLEYTNLDISPSDVPGTIISDICAERIEDIGIEPGSLSFVYASDVFEHLKRPWIAADNIVELLKPGGVVFVLTVWSWRHHPLPVDYWRFSADCLRFLFEKLDCIDADFDASERRKDIRGFWPNKKDYVPIDELGGWRENWSVYYIGRKPASSS